MSAPEFTEPMSIKGLSVGVVHWFDEDHAATQFGQVVDYLGGQSKGFMFNSKMPDSLDMVIARGPFGSLVPIANQILALPVPQRPAFILMMSEQLPNPKIPEWIRYWGGILRTRIERIAYSKPESDKWQASPKFKWITSKAHRFRYYGDLWWLRRQGILSVLSISSKWTGEFLRVRGFDPLVLPIGHLPDKYDNLELERNVPVLWLGKIGSPRRGRILKDIRKELRTKGVEMLVIDGVENPYVFGDKCSELLSRTKIALNLLRSDWDDNSMRYLIAAPRRALIVGEITLPHTDFMPGVHRIEAPVGKLAETILYYLDHEEERRRIADQAYQLVTSYSPIDRVLHILETGAAVKIGGKA